MIVIYTGIEEIDKEIQMNLRDSIVAHYNVYTVHTLRHTCATLLYRSGVNIKTIQELLGHVHIDTTEIYTHLDNQEVKDVMFEHPLAQFKMEDALAYCA